MSAPEQSSETLLARVGARQMIARFGRWTFLGTLAAAVLYLIALLVARLLALIPDYFEPWTVALIPGVGLLIGFIFGLRRPQREGRCLECQQPYP